MPLEDFEEYIDPTILERGHTYFTSGRVNEPDELYPGQFEATVLGSRPYNVRITYKEEQITQYSCTCPYDHGPICKHVVALLYYLRQNMEDGSSDHSQKSSKRKTVADQVEELLDRISREDLIEFSRNLAIKDKQYRNKLMTAFVHLNQNESKAFYAGQVRHIVDTAVERHGYVGWEEAGMVARQVNKLLDKAEKQAGDNQYKSAIYICFGVMEGMFDALGYIDDSNGDISGVVYGAFEVMLEMVDESLPEPDRKEFFEACFSAFEEGMFSGWDWHTGMLDLLAMLYKTEEEAEHILELIERASLSGYDLESAQYIQLQIIEELKGGEEASQFAARYIANPRIRRAAIQQSIEDQQYEEAISIAKDGIEHDKKEKPGLVSDWYEYLLEIARHQNDREKIIAHARKLFVDGRYEKQAYYDLMEKQVPNAEWTDFVEELISDIKKKNSWLDFNLIAQIYINEQWWDRLFELVMEDPTLQSVANYEKHLSKDYAEEIAELYEQEILSLMENNTGRKYYRTACRFIGKIAKLESKNKASQLVQKLKTTYPRRPAMIEELNKLGL